MLLLPYRILMPSPRTTHRTIAQDYALLDRPEACAYSRVSLDATGEKTSVTGQLSENADIAARLGAHLPDRRNRCDNDVGVSAHSRKKKGGRPEWDATWDDVEAGRVHVVILRSTARADRTSRWNDFVDLCEERRVMLAVAGTLYDPGDNNHRVMLGISGEFARYQARQTHKDVLIGKQKAAEAGRPAGMDEYGLVRVRDSKGAITAVVPATDPIRPGGPSQIDVVKRVFREIRQRRPYSRICADLNSEGIPSPHGRRWHPESLKALVRSHRWRGLRQHYDDLYPAMWPRIIDEDEWQEVQQIISVRRGPTRRTSAKWLCGGLVKCPVCWAGIVKGGRDKYWCRGHEPGDPRGRGHVSIMRPVADTIVTMAVIGQLSDPRLRGRYAVSDAEKEERERAEVALDALDVEEAAVLELRREKKVGLLLAQAELDRIGQERAALEPLLVRRLPHPLLDRLASPNPLAVRSEWDALGVYERRDVLAWLAPHIVLLPVGSGRRRSVERPEESFRFRWGWEAPLEEEVAV